MSIESSTQLDYNVMIDPNIEVTLTKSELRTLIISVSETMYNWHVLRGKARDNEVTHVTVEGCAAVFDSCRDLYDKLEAKYREHTES